MGVCPCPCPCWDVGSSVWGESWNDGDVSEDVDDEDDDCGGISGVNEFDEKLNGDADPADLKNKFPSS